MRFESGLKLTIFYYQRSLNAKLIVASQARISFHFINNLLQVVYVRDPEKRPELTRDVFFVEELVKLIQEFVPLDVEKLGG